MRIEQEETPKGAVTNTHTTQHDGVVTAKHGQALPESSCSRWGQCQAASGLAGGIGEPFPQGSHGRLPGGVVPPQPHTAVWQTAGGAPSESQMQHTSWGGWLLTVTLTLPTPLTHFISRHTTNNARSNQNTGIVTKSIAIVAQCSAHVMSGALVHPRPSSTSTDVHTYLPTPPTAGVLPIGLTHFSRRPGRTF